MSHKIAVEEADDNRYKRGMKQRHRHSPHYRQDERSLAATLIKSLLLITVIGGVAGLTWVAIVPLDAPSHEVIRTVPNDRLGTS